MKECQPTRCPGSQMAAMAFVNPPDYWVRQSFFDAVFDPCSLRVAIQSAIGSNPDTSIARSRHAVDLIKIRVNSSPIFSVEFPDGIGCSAPYLSIGCFNEGNYVASHGIFTEGLPFLAVIPEWTVVAAQPQISILRFKKRRSLAIRRLGRKRLENSAIVFFKTA